MLVKLYIHPNKLTNLNNNEAVLAKQMPNSQYEIEVFIDTREYNISYQQNGVLVSKKTFIQRLFKKG
ncbi:MAG: hypothetical protein IJF92_00680 [Bacilli bacterium]|nr:hypothetical protein [Bacilli bacterium]MBQ3307671.1 hypothetical protein [Bacilli bacterium]MBQ3423265.1 hypothetical protein [Romboutsia sp.]